MRFCNRRTTGNRFCHFVLLLALLCLQACAANTFEFLQTYDNVDLEDSEVAWVLMGKSYEADSTVAPGHLEIRFTKGKSLFSMEYRGGIWGVDVFAFPSGIVAYDIRYSYQVHAGKIFTNWITKTDTLMGGKCYVASSRQTKEKGLISSTDYHKFLLEETRVSDCFIIVPRSKKLKLSRITGSSPGKRELVTYKLSDDLFAPYVSKNNSNYVSLPREFLLELYRGMPTSK